MYKYIFVRDFFVQINIEYVYHINMREVHAYKYFIIFNLFLY